MKALSLDFDGVIHSYTSGWHGEGRAPDPPVEGAIEFIREAMNHFKVVIFSNRNQHPAGQRCIRNYLLRHGLEQELVEQIEFPRMKPKCFLHIDDRGWRFDGTFPSMDTVARFKPWNR